MKKLSTSCMNETDNRNEKDIGLFPRQRTLDFLSQFARVYHAEPVLKANFGGLILN